MKERKIIIVYDAECNFMIVNDKYEAAELIKSEILERGNDMGDVQVYRGVPMDVNISYKNAEIELIEVEDGL